jgi:large subunit ribosomal protein L19e
MQLKAKKRLAARVLGVGVDRVLIDPSRASDVSAAISRDDIRRLIRQGAIRAKPKMGTSRERTRKIAEQKRKGRRRGHGSRKGVVRAREGKKKRWAASVRPLRRRLRELKTSGVINQHEYRGIYRMVNGGTIRGKGRLDAYLKEKGLLKEEKR